MSVTSDELNYFIYRYLQESGFTHSAFTFGNEACVHQSNITGTSVPPGALISIVQKGLQFVDAELSITADGKLLDEGLVEPLSLIDAVRPDLTSRMLRMQVGHAREKTAVIMNCDENPLVEMESETKQLCMETDDQSEVRISNELISPTAAKTEVGTPNTRVRTINLTGHTSEVFICAWNPKLPNVLASGSGDSTARIWKVASQESPVILRHPQTDYLAEGSRGVTTLDWNFDGTLLATGSYDGIARVWSPEDASHTTLMQHHAPIFVLKWSPHGDSIVSGGVDKYVVLWDPKRGMAKCQVELNKAATLDIDWQTNETFASCSSDKTIKICRVDENKFTIVKTFQGHTDEVNAIKWNPAHNILASCSDDRSAKIWNPRQDTCVHDLKEHTEGIYTLRWSPDHGGATRYLATGSFDSTVKLWDVEIGGNSLHTFNQHKEAVYSVVFSPDGRYLATGSFDKYVHIWSVKNRTLLFSHQGNAGIFEVCWSTDGNQLACSYADSLITILDVRCIDK